jgi:hypothetical protein
MSKSLPTNLDNRTKYKKIAVRVVVTFVEGFLAYWATTGNLTTKTALTGAVAAGVSAVYNLSRHYLGY